MSYQPRRDFLSFSFCFFMGMIYFLLFNYNITILNIPFQTTHMTWHSKMPQSCHQESILWAYMFTQEIKILRPRVIKGLKQERSDNQLIPDLGLGSKAPRSFSYVMLLPTFGYISFFFFHDPGVEVHYQINKNLKIQHKSICQYAEHGDMP